MRGRRHHAGVALGILAMLVAVLPAQAQRKRRLPQEEAPQQDADRQQATENTAPTTTSTSEGGEAREPREAKPGESQEPKNVAADETNGNTAPAPQKSETPAKFTFIPGFRVQLRGTHDSHSGTSEFFVPRVRLKAKGVLFGYVKYGVEFKFDGLAQTGKSPKEEFENAWLEFPTTKNLTIRVGLYDIPFSRNALTSDSKLLLVDRSLGKDALTSVGFADNTVGLMGHGRPMGGRIEYAVGIFNNVKFTKFGHRGAKRSDHMMPAGRIVFNILDPSKQGGYGDYQGSYLGEGRRLAIGTNSAYLRRARDGSSEFNLAGWGADVFFGNGPFSFEAEYDVFERQMVSGGADIRTHGWHVQAGYLVWRRVEFALRHQSVDPNTRASDDRQNWSSVGVNVYFLKHNLKLQTDYTFRQKTGTSPRTNFFQIQLQADFN